MNIHEETLKIARNLIKKDPNLTDWVISKFPELKEESKDERIKNELLSFLKEGKPYHCPNSVKRQEWAAWVEKQGNNMGISEATKKKLEDNLNKALEKETPESWNKFLDEQSEQKPIDKIQLGKKYKCIASPRYSTFMIGEIYKPEDEFLCSLMNLCSDCFELIEDGEPKDYNSIDPHFGKPIDKIEPKFKIEKDKWYVCISQYCNCIEGRNYRASLDGRIIDDYGTEYDMHNDAYKYFRLWTIQDAKDGDILNSVRVNATIIFKSFVEDGKHIVAYCALQKGIFIKQEMLWDRDFEPSPKNWKEELFLKMKEAEYEWDSENKELKKIVDEEQTKKLLQDNSFRRMFEHKSAWSEEDNIMAHDIDYALRGQIIYPISKLQSISTWINNLKNRVQPKQKWSKKDIRLLNNCISLIEDIDCTKEEQNFLKSLKERVQPQPKQEWSEEDEEILNTIINHFKIDIECTDEDDIIKWLKSLKERYTWKPSDEQIKALSAINVTGRICYVGQGQELINLYNDLKKLKGE